MNVALIAAGAAGAMLVACGGDDADDGDDPPPAPTATVEAPATASPHERAAALCAGAQVTAAPPVVQAAEVVEISGLAASRTNPGVLWAHNDSGDTARAISFTTDGTPRGVYTIVGAEAIDWEDMAIAPIREEATPALFDLFFGDIGDNAAVRSAIVVYRVREPAITAATGGALKIEQRIVLHYPDAAHDAETLLADPVTGDLFIVTKEIVAGDSGVYRASAAALAAGGGGAMERVGTITKATLTSAVMPPDDASALVRGVGWLPTGGDISRDGALIAIRTYASVFIWAREEGQPVAAALAGTPCEAPSAIEPQGEAIAFAAEGEGYFTVSEGAMPPLYEFGP